MDAKGVMEVDNAKVVPEQEKGKCPICGKNDGTELAGEMLVCKKCLPAVRGIELMDKFYAGM